LARRGYGLTDVAPHGRPEPDETSKWAIVRNSHDPIVVNVEPIADAQREATSLVDPRVLSRDLPLGS